MFGFGLVAVLYGLGLLEQGIFVYHNGHRAEMYAPAVVVTGVLFGVLALLPNSFVERLVRRNTRYR